MQSLGHIGVQVYCMGRPGYLSSFHEFPESIDDKLFLGGTNQAKRRRILSSQNAAPDIFPKNRQNASGSGQRSENVLDSHSVSRTKSEAGIRRFAVPKSDVLRATRFQIDPVLDATAPLTRFRMSCCSLVQRFSSFISDSASLAIPVAFRRLCGNCSCLQVWYSSYGSSAS
jgi:hypothetical protein